MDRSVPDPEEVHAHRWWSLVVICMALTVITVDVSILNVALPTIVRDLRATGADLQWIVDSYIIVFACMLLVAGALGDRFGRKGALAFGLAVFGVCSGIASVASSPGMLIVMRGLMGVGAAFMFPTTLSMITNIFVGTERARAIGIWSGMAGAGVAVGPLAGGVLVEHFSWGSVFLVNVPICAAALVLGYFFIPTSRDPSGRPLDPIGALLSVFTLLALVYAIIEAPQLGWAAPEVLLSFAAGSALLVGFLRWERRTPHPMLELTVFRNPRFSAASLVLTITSFALQGSVFLSLQYFQFFLGYAPFKAGLLSIPVAIGIICMAPFSPRLVLRWGTKRVVMIGLTTVGVALGLYGVDTVMSTFVGAVLVRLAHGLGMGLINAPATESVMGSLPKSRAGVGSAVNDTARHTGGAFGIAVFGSISLAFYHHLAIASAKLGSASRAALHDSIGSAVTVARSLRVSRAAEATDLLARSRGAFLDAIRLTYPLAVVLMTIAVFVAWRWLPATAPVHEGDTLEVMAESAIAGEAPA